MKRDIRQPCSPGRFLILLAAAFVLFGDAARAAEEGEWKIVFHETFDRSKRELESRGWWFEDRADITVQREQGESYLDVRVDERTSDSGYANLHHPLDPTKRYRIRATLRADGVEKHPNRRSNRGAVVFGPFSDLNGGWLRGGAFLQGLHGTSDDWQELVAGPIEVFPQDARYLRIMLGIEGYGRARFKSVTLEQQPSAAHPLLKSPDPGETVATRHPIFSWESRLNHADVHLELRREPRADAAGIDLKDSDVSLMQVREPLDAGQWYWRVTERLPSVDSAHASDWQVFEVAPDPQAEQVLIVPNWHEEQVNAADLQVYIAGVDDSDLVHVRIGEVPAEVNRVKANVFQITPASALPKAIHDVVIEVADREGEVVRHEDIYVNKEAGSVVRITEDGGLTIDGEPFFPIGAFRDPSDSLDDFSGLLEAGFNMAHDYKFEHGQANLEQARAYLQAAGQAGLKVFMGLHRGDTHADRTLQIRRRVAALMDEPALLSWYLYDEPEVNQLGAFRLEKMNRLIRAIDPHQVSSVLLSRPRLTGVYSQTADVMWVDPYPVPQQPVLMVEQWVKQTRERVGPGRPVWAVLQAHDIRYWNNPEQALARLGPPVRPTYEEMRCMTHLALAAGAKGLVYYWGPTTRYHIRDDAPQVWQGLCEVVGELNELEPFLLAGVRTDELDVPSPLRAWTSETSGERVVVLINPMPERVTVPADALRAMLPGEGDSVTSVDGTAAFERYEVKVFRRTTR